METQRTLAIIKPDAVEQRHIGAILARIEKEGFRVAGLRMVRMSQAEAQGFYAVHRGKPFFEDLTTFMSSGPAVVMVLEAEGVIARWREVMGATNPEQAAPGTLRKQFATNIERNAVHGSDAIDTAANEIAYFFGAIELI